MIQDSGLSLTQEEEEELPRLMAAIPGLKQRIAGKSLPMEKYAIRKAERWTAQGGRLTLPGLELVYLWNGFSIMGLDYTRAERYLVTIEAEMEAAQRRRAAGGQEQFEVEDDCLLLLLKGMCLKYMSAPMGAEECFREVINRAGGEGARLKADKYLLPYATVELALILMEAGDNEEAASLLEAAKGYKEYSLQSRLHFRIHAAQNKILAGNNNNEEQEKVSKVYVVMSPLSINHLGTRRDAQFQRGQGENTQGPGKLFRIATQRIGSSYLNLFPSQHSSVSFIVNFFVKIPHKVRVIFIYVV